MAFNDSLSDMLARIKNAHRANKAFTSCYKSKLNMNVLSVLKDEGYIRDFKDVELRKGINNIKIDNQTFKNININENKSLTKTLINLKNTYENHWKNINKINII